MNTNIKESLFDEIVSLINQPCDDHEARIKDIQDLVTTRECPECHAKQFLVLGARGQCQYCGARLTLLAAQDKEDE
jgi:hypothetical protein